MEGKPWFKDYRRKKLNAKNEYAVIKALGKRLIFRMFTDLGLKRLYYPNYLLVICDYIAF